MPMFEDDADALRLYYTTSEVAALFGVSDAVVRRWEREFEHVRPHKNSRGTRRFTKQNIEDLRLVYHLVRERGLTIEGARQEIAAGKKRDKQKKEILEELGILKDFLRTLKAQL